MTYVRQAGRSTAARQARRRAAIVLSVLSGCLLIAFLIALAVNLGWLGDRSESVAAPSASPSCSGVQPAAPKDVMVNVYNATTRAGLAGTTAKALRDQGFRTLAVTNDPLRKKIAGVGEIRHGTNGQEAAAAVLLRIPAATLVSDTRADASVDVALGEGFQGVTVVQGAPPPC